MTNGRPRRRSIFGGFLFILVGTLLLLAALQRAIAPGSKASLADWHAQSVLRRLVPARAAQLSSQRFWDAMSRVESRGA